MEKGEKREVSIHVDALPAAAYEVVTDVTRMGEWSPECVGGQWLDGATGPAVGAHFKGSNKRGLLRWSTKPEVVAAEPEREFAFVVGGASKWSYRFEADGTGTTIVESFELLQSIPWYYGVVERYLMRIPDRGADIEAGMRTTLDRIKVAVERTS